MDKTKLNIAEIKMSQEMKSLRAKFPKRLIYGAINPKTFAYRVGAGFDKKAATTLSSRGWLVYGDY